MSKANNDFATHIMSLLKVCVSIPCHGILWITALGVDIVEGYVWVWVNDDFVCC